MIVSKKALDRIPYTPERCTHSQEHTYMINDLTEFVNSNLEKYIQSGKDIPEKYVGYNPTNKTGSSM